jgi:hypothetical protein
MGTLYHSPSVSSSLETSLLHIKVILFFKELNNQTIDRSHFVVPTLTQHTSYTCSLFYQHSHSTLHTLAVCSSNTHTAHSIHSQSVLPTLTQHTPYTRSLFYQHSHSTLHTLAYTNQFPSHIYNWSTYNSRPFILFRCNQFYSHVFFFSVRLLT